MTSKHEHCNGQKLTNWQHFLKIKIFNIKRTLHYCGWHFSFFSIVCHFIFYVPLSNIHEWNWALLCANWMQFLGAFGQCKLCTTKGHFEHSLQSFVYKKREKFKLLLLVDNNEIVHSKMKRSWKVIEKIKFLVKGNWVRISIAYNLSTLTFVSEFAISI